MSKGQRRVRSLSFSPANPNAVIAARYFAEHPDRIFSELALELIVAGIQGVRVGVEVQEEHLDTMDDEAFDALLEGF